MRSRFATLRLTPCLIAAAVALLLSGNTAAASCGDYVHIRGGSSQAADTQHTPPADNPCAHGKCDRLPIAPPAPEPTAPTGSGPTDAVLATLDAFTCPAAFGPAADPAGVPVRSAFVPFHPPRV